MKNILFFGGGNIAQALISGLLLNGMSNKNIFFVDRNPLNQKKLSNLKVKSLKKSNSDIDIVILSVKPKDAIQAYKEILNNYKNPKIVSLVAGIKSSSYIKLDNKCEFMRAMPNTASKYGQGITALYNSSFKKSNFRKVSSIFSKLGTVIEVDNDSKIDTFTGVIGSGPAYFFQTLKSFEKKLMRLCNQDEKIVREIIANLMKGVGSSIEKDGDLDNLIKAVASKKGTTEAGLKSLKSNNLNQIFEKGLNAAIKRSKEISNEF